MSNYNDILQRGDKIGCYRIEEVLGRGGFAVTYLATDENLDVQVAIKEYLPREITQRDQNLQVSALKPEFAEDYDVGLENFAREAKTLARFKHPHIVRVHQVLHANNTAYMVMDFEHGQELGELLEKQQTLSEDELRGILFPILDGVEEIHRHGFVHRDIKPSNIYVRHNGSPVLIDFGAARYALSETTQQLTAVVTVGYTPIEQYNVSEDAQGAWSDIYALAAVCYEAATGEVPADSVTRASASVTNGDDPLPSVRASVKREYSDDCLDAIDWGLRMDSEDRPQVIAQWRDAFDGIFNPASAYAPRPDNASIYDSHASARPSARPTTRPLQPRGDRAPTSTRDDVTSIPLQSADTTMDTGVVSLNRDSTVTSMPPPLHQPSHQSNRPDTSNVTEHPSAKLSANDSPSRNVLLRDTGKDSVSSAEPQRPQRSKFERPSHLAETPKKRTMHDIRDEIEFDETDWDYEPPKKSSAWKFLVPAIGLVAVVGGSLLYVNNPEMITSLGKRGSDITSEQALGLAEARLDSQDFIFPKDESALDYYRIILEEDPANLEARAGIRSIETAVRQQIAQNMQDGNESEANRILARADEVGLAGIYGASESNSDTNTDQTMESTTANTSPEVSSTEGTTITPVNTASLETTSTSTTRVEPSEVFSSISSSGIDSRISPFIQGKIDRINSLIEEQRFDEAKALYLETDEFIPDQATSRTLLRKITEGELGIESAADAQIQAEEEARQAEIQAAERAEAEAARLAKEQSDAEAEAEAARLAQQQQQQQEEEEEQAEAARLAAIEAAEQQQAAIAASAANTTSESTPEPVAPTEPPRNSYIDATGPAADHLNELRLALEAKDIDAVIALSQPLPAERIRFLNTTFARAYRLDVVIEDVTASGDTVSGRVDVALFGQSEDGSVYGLGKWNGAIIESTRSNGQWQKIRW